MSVPSAFIDRDFSVAESSVQPKLPQLNCFICYKAVDVERFINKLCQRSVDGSAFVAIDFEWSADGSGRQTVQAMHVGWETSPDGYECYIIIIVPEMTFDTSPLYQLLHNANIIKMGFDSTGDMDYVINTFGIFPSPYIDAQALLSLQQGQPRQSLSVATYKSQKISLPPRPLHQFTNGVCDQSSAQSMAMESFAIYRLCQSLIKGNNIATTKPASPRSVYSAEPPPPRPAPVRSLSPTSLGINAARSWVVNYLNGATASHSRARVINYMTNSYSPWVRLYPQSDERRQAVADLLDEFFAMDLSV